MSVHVHRNPCSRSPESPFNFTERRTPDPQPDAGRRRVPAALVEAQLGRRGAGIPVEGKIDLRIATETAVGVDPRVAAPPRRWTWSALRLLETTPDAVVVVDSEGKIAYANRQIEALFGYSPDELRGRSVEMLVPNALRARHRRLRHDYNRAPVIRPMGLGADLYGLHRSGREFPIDTALSPIETEGGPLTITAVRDMTDRRRTEAALRKVREKARRELAAAARIQRSLLPGRQARVPGVEVEWVYEPSERLGGDSFNVFEVAPGQVGFYLLDVTGHGMVAALQSVALTRVLASTWAVEGRDSPSRLIAWLNTLFPVQPDGWQYFKFLCGMLDLAAGRLRYASAGHPGPVHVPRGGEPEALEAAGFPIGWFPEAEYEEFAARLAPGDRLYLYSDGVSEAMNAGAEDFGVAGLVTSLAETRGEPLGLTVRELRRAVGRWRGGRDRLDDDLTLLALEIAPEV